MSLVDDHIKRIDARLDKYTVVTAEKHEPSEDEVIAADATTTVPVPQDNDRCAKLKSLIRSLSTTSNPRPLLSTYRLCQSIAEIENAGDGHPAEADERDLEWLAAAKATIQAYGVVLNTLLDQTIPLSDSIYYWDDVLGSYAGTGLYTLQSSPFRVLDQVKEVYADAKTRYESSRTLRESAQETAQQTQQTLAQGWKEFYRLVEDSIRERSLVQARQRILTPFALCRVEARKKQIQIKKLREQCASAIGLLVDEGLLFDEVEFNTQSQNWKHTITRSVGLLEGLFNCTRLISFSISDFEVAVIDSICPYHEDNPRRIAGRLLHILDVRLSLHERDTENHTREYGKPSKLFRYWIPGLLLFLTSGTLLRVLANRKEQVVNWVRELGQTSIDFWYNWVVDPVKRLIGTIRHDANSELAIMSKDSLRADRDSLERMVVDFAVAHPENGSSYTDAQIAELRAQVRKGDLTAVLRAYERDIQSPVKNALLGNLAQALLIQVQKTKVDLEVAMNGIDDILKSQELLFGFVGVAPGMVLTYLVFRWLASTVSNRRGIRELRKQGETVRLLR